MKIAEYNQMMAYLTRPGFQEGTPKPGRTFEDKLRTLKSVSQGISPESRIRLLDYFIQEALGKGEITEEQASGIYNRLQEDKDKIREQIDAYERENFSEGSKDEQRKIADDEYYASLQNIIERDPGAKNFFDPDDITYPAMDQSGNYNYKGIQAQIDDIDKFKKYAERRGLDKIISPESTFEEKIKKGQYPVGIFERPVETGTEPMDLRKMQTILHEARHKIMMKPEFQKIMDKYFLKEETFVRYLDKEFFPELDAYLPDFEYPEEADKVYKKAVEEYKDKFTKEDKGFINKLKSFFAQGGRAGFREGTQQSRTAAGTFDKVYSMAEIRKLGKELNVSEFKDGVKLTPDEYRSNVTKAKSRKDFYKNQFKSLSPAKQKAYMKDFMKQIAKHQDGGFYLSAANRVPNATFVKRYFPNIDSKTANKIVTSINGILLNDFKNKGNVIKTSPKANANAIRMEDMRKITNPTFETAEGVQGTKGASLQHVASKNRLVTLNNLAYMNKVLNSSLSQNDKRIKIIENEVDRLIKAKPKNYVERVNALNNEGMALASGYIKKDGKIVKGPTAGYSEFRIKDPLNEKISFFGKDDAKTILPDKDSVLIQQDADLIDKPVKDMSPEELKRAKTIASKNQIEFLKNMKIATDGPTLGANLGLLKGLGETIKSIPTPTGTLALTAGFGVDPASAIDRSALGLEAALAPELVKQTSRLTSNPIVQRFFNLGLSPKMAMRLARAASPLGIASLVGEGGYQLYKAGKAEKEKLDAMTPEERRGYLAEQEEQMGVSA